MSYCSYHHMYNAQHTAYIRFAGSEHSLSLCPHMHVCAKCMIGWYADAGATCAVCTVLEASLHGTRCIGPLAWPLRSGDKALAIQSFHSGSLPGTGSDGVL